MATLVLSTVGNVLGGPVGGAIGALIGQSIDQELLAPSQPKHGDLKVQSSDYGTAIPRIYGRMRVAGSVIWATELQESGDTQGAKGQSGTTTSYQVSFAVALSSRIAKDVRRIWADGKLLRGEDGEFKVDTQFRFYPGSEDQVVDPLIASIEGAAGVPAYRGVSIAVFENLQLSEFGNRLPFLTFEMVGDDEDPGIGTIVHDCTGGIVSCDDIRTVIGYAAYGSDARAAITPLIEAFGLSLFDDGAQVRSSADSPIEIPDLGECGNSDRGKEPTIERDIATGAGRPQVVRLAYYDPARDYQTGEERAWGGAQSGSVVRQAIPAVMSASAAKGLSENILNRAACAGEKLTLRLSPSYLWIEPGTEIVVPLSPSRWVVESVTVDAFVPVVEMTPQALPASTDLLADPGRALVAPDLTYLAPHIALFEAPAGMGEGGATALLLAASSAGSGWRSYPVRIETDGWQGETTLPRRKTVLGVAETILGDGQAAFVDLQASLTIALHDSNQWLESRDYDALAQGDNLAFVGSELIQFGSATPLGEGRYLLERLLRGRGGTEWAMGSHGDGEDFALFDPSRLSLIQVPDNAVGQLATARSTSSRWEVSTATKSIFGLRSRPLAPVRLVAECEADGAMTLSWIMRSRGNWTWRDGIDAPIGESFERYRVSIAGSGSSITIETSEETLVVSAAQRAALGAGTATITVVQVGDQGLSPAATTTLTL